MLLEQANQRRGTNCVSNRRDDKCTRNVKTESLKEIDHLGDLGLDRRTDKVSECRLDSPDSG